MKVLAFLIPWLVAGIAVFAVAFRPIGEREKRRFTPASRSARLGLIGLLLAAGVAIPVSVVVQADDQVPAPGGSFTAESSDLLRDGRLEFRRTCASCHTLAAASAQGVTGPSLDEIAPDAGRVQRAIKIGGSGAGLMPAGLLLGDDAKKVAEYVAMVAGREAK